MPDPNVPTPTFAFGEEREKLPVRPDDLRLFRIARLLLMLEVAEELQVKRSLDIERLGFYDFFADNPFLVIGDEDRGARREVLLAGFSYADLSYQSSGHRFTNRRARLQHDLASLIGYGAVEASAKGSRVVYRITDRGRELTAAFASLYAQAYRASARLILRRLDKLSDRRLREDGKAWLNDERLLIDLYDVEEQ